MLKEIPGITPAKLYEGCTRNAYHLYMFRYKSEPLGGLPRAKFLSALDAEGIPCSAGYSPLNKESFLPTALNSKGFRRMYPKEILDRYEERNTTARPTTSCAMRASGSLRPCSWEPGPSWTMSPPPCGRSTPTRKRCSAFEGRPARPRT
jgi:hypothetical protein